MMVKRLVLAVLLVLTALAATDIRTSGPAVLGAYFERLASRMDLVNRQADTGPEVPQHTTAGKVEEPAEGFSTLSIENVRGNTTVTGVPSHRVKVAYSVTVYGGSEEAAREYAESIAIALQRNGGVLKVATSPPVSSSPSLKGLQVDYIIEVPKGLAVQVVNSEGQVQVADVAGDVTITNKLGPTTVTRVTGDISLISAFGSITATEIQGNVKLADTSQGSLLVTDVTGNVVATTGFGSLEVRRVAGNVEAACTHGDAAVSDVSGSVNARCGFGRFIVADIKGPVTAECRHGSITATGIKNSVDLKAQNGSISVELVKGVGGYNVNATARNGRITTTLPLKMARSPEERKEELTGSFDGGKFNVKLSSEFGSISLTAR